MRKSGEERRKLGEIETQVFAERVAQYLRGRHPAKTAFSVEIDTGIPAKTISKWLDLTSAPSGKAYHRLLLTYPDLLCFVTPEDSPVLFQHAARLALQSDLEAKAAAIRAQLSDLRSQP